MFMLNTFFISPNLYNTASRWLFSTNHKDIGVMYIIFGAFSAISSSIKFSNLLIRMELINLINFLIFTSSIQGHDSDTDTISITNQDSITADAGKNVSEMEHSLSPLKPKRGRPKKGSNIIEGEKSIVKPRKNKNEVNISQKKPRGRPKKEKKENPIEQKKPRGRPRKE